MDAIEYTKQGDQFVRGDTSCSEVALVYDTTTGEVIRHGPYAEMRRWYFDRVREIQAGGGVQSSEGVLPLGCVCDRDWTAEEVNRLIRHGVRPGDPEAMAHPTSSKKEAFEIEKMPPLRGGGVGAAAEPGGLPKGPLEFVAAVTRFKVKKTDWVVLLVNGFDPDGSPAQLCGEADPGEIQVGVTYRFMGKWKRHEKYGLQFHFLTFGQDVPHDRTGVIAYLVRTIEGVGEVTASRLWDAYGTDTIQVLATDHNRAVDDGLLSAQVAEAASLSFSRDVFYRTRIDLLSIFDKQGIPSYVVDHCISEWGADAPQTIKDNPFALLAAGIPGCGFARVDALYLNLGHPANSPVRQAYAAWHAVSSSPQGHTWVSDLEVAGSLQTTLKDEALPALAVREAIDRVFLVARTGRDGHRTGRWLATPDDAANERRVWEEILRLSSGDRVHWPKADEVRDLDDHQREKWSEIAGNPVAILTGTPGSGKTHVLVNVIETILRRKSHLVVGVCAPTGKAAQRCTEVFASRRLNFMATTIHSMLAVGVHRGRWMFRANRDNQLAYDVVVIDEASMVNVDLMAAVLVAMKPGANLLLVGDPNQLPPIGHGAPLRDLLACPVPAAELINIHRNGGDITKACQQIRRGKPFHFSEGVDFPNGHNFVMQPCENAVEMAAQLCHFLTTQKTFHPVDQIQIVTMLNKGSAVAREELNLTLQNTLNPSGRRGEGVTYRVGDKVICLRNGWYRGAGPSRADRPAGEESSDYVALPTSNGDSRVGYCFLVNGDMGRVIAVGDHQVVMRFGDRVVLLGRWFRFPGVVNGPMVTYDGDHFALGYAVTVHKFQGSSAPCVIFMADPSTRANWLGSRELVYTAFSRGERLTAVFGNQQTVNRWAGRQTIHLRKTFLRDDLLAELRPPVDVSQV